MMNQSAISCIKAEFVKDENSHGGFTLKACQTSMIRETIPEVAKSNTGISIYACNLYIKSGTFAPEPQNYLYLMPGESTSQKLDFQEHLPPPPSSRFFGLQQSIAPIKHMFDSTQALI
jgi:hypothetical protein